MGKTRFSRLTLALAKTTLLMLLGTFSQAQVSRLGQAVFHNTMDVIGPDRSDILRAKSITSSNDDFALISSGTEALLEPQESVSIATQATVCSNELPFYWNGEAYSESGNFSKQITRANGTTELATLNLTVQRAGTWYPDADGDGFGNSNNPTLFCEAPSGFVTNALDCNDYDPTIQEPTEYFIDADLDGYGSEIGVALCSSTAPFGYSPVHTDCDDRNSSLHPNSAKHCKGINNELNAATLAVFPNPGSGKFQVDIQRMEGKADLQVFNVQGVLVWERIDQELIHAIDLDLENQPSGMYWLKFSTPGFSQNLKLVKQ